LGNPVGEDQPQTQPAIGGHADVGFHDQDDRPGEDSVIDAVEDNASESSGCGGSDLARVVSDDQADLADVATYLLNPMINRFIVPPLPTAFGPPPPDGRAVHTHKTDNLKEAFAWADFSVQVLKESRGIAGINDLALKLETCTISTAFSGIDCPATAHKLLRHAVGKALGRRLLSPANLSAIEWNVEAQNELAKHPDAALCMYGDITDFFVPPVQATVNAMIESKSFDRALHLLGPVVKSGRAVSPMARCVNHQGHCRLQRARLHIAGTPCTDWSQAGDQAKTSGITMVHFLAWVALRRLIREPMLVQENVPLFPQALLIELLGDLYEFQFHQTSPVDHGFPVVRKRQYAIGRLPSSTLSWDIQGTDFIDKFRRIGGFGLDAFFVAPRADLLAELAWASGRPSSVYHSPETNLISAVVPQSPSHRLRDEQRSIFWFALTKTEHRYIEVYIQKKGTNKVFMLGQNPEQRVQL
jgi:hypothetical protein